MIQSEENLITCSNVTMKKSKYWMQLIILAYTSRPFLLEGKLLTKLAHLVPRIQAPAQQGYRCIRRPIKPRLRYHHITSVEILRHRHRRKNKRPYHWVSKTLDRKPITCWSFTKFFFHCLPLTLALSSRCKPSTISFISFPRFIISVASCTRAIGYFWL